MGSGAKSYMRKGFLIMRKRANISSFMRRPLVLYNYAPDPIPLNFLIYEENFIFFFISVSWGCKGARLRTVVLGFKDRVVVSKVRHQRRFLDSGVP